MSRPLQPEFKIRLYAKGIRPTADETFHSQGSDIRTSEENFNFMDIETCVDWGVRYEENASLLNTLTFTVNKWAESLLYRFFVGQWVTLYAGYYDENGAGVRKVFSGTVVRLKSNFPDNGRISFRVECMSYGYTQMAKDVGAQNYVYPDPKSDRPFAKGKSTLTLSELVTGLIEQSGLEIGQIVLPKSVTNYTLTETNIRYQKGVTDWQFLNDLAKNFGCTLWTDTVDGRELVYFVDTATAKTTISDDIGFLYPLNGLEGSYNSTGYVRESEWNKEGGDPTWYRPRLLRNVVVEEDISLAYAVSRNAVFFDKSTGEYVEGVAKITEDEGRRVITFYTLDESKVEEIHRTNPELANKLRSYSPFDTPWQRGEIATPEDAAYYYKAHAVYDEEVAVFDNAFFGITVKAICNQDLNIRSQRTYNLRGILRYSSSERTGRYYLRGLAHTWDESGRLTELDFIV